MEIQQLAKQYVYWPEIDNKYQKNVDLSKITLGEIHPLLNEISQQNKESVTLSISKFYFYNEALARLRQSEDNILNLEQIKIYQQYTKNIHDLSKKIFAYIFTICLMEARHCKDFEQLKQIKNNVTEKYKYSLNKPDYSVVEEKILKLRNTFFRKNYKPIISNLKQFNNHKIIYDLIEPLSQLQTYDRTEINEIFLPLLLDNKYSNLTIEDILKSLHVIFVNNNFRSSSFGGKSWADIAEHGLKFIKGEINPEVFVDQAFSLEHNGGQIFNKAIIFKSPKSVTIQNPDLEFNYNSYNTTLETQLLLNMQHHGQLLNFLINPIINKKITTNHFSFVKYKQLVKQETSNLGKIQNYRYIRERLSINLEVLQNLQKNILLDLELQPIIEELKKVNIKGTAFKSFEVFSNLRGSNTYTLPNERKSLCDIQDIFMTQESIPVVKKIKKNKTKTFIFEKFETSSIPSEKMTKEILGNKAYGLAEMQKLSLPVPKAIVLPTTNSDSFFNNKTKWNSALKKTLPDITKYFTDSNDNPILCSIRSGSAISMPGMMDTILNVGIDNSSYEKLCTQFGKGMINEWGIKFITLFTKSLIGETIKYSKNLEAANKKFRKILTKHNIPYSSNENFPLKAEEQYKWCLEAVFNSWHSERATAYREHQGISHDIGTAAIAQQRGFGNLNNKSCTGVVFSRDCISGEKGIIGEFLIRAQGEDVVSGAVTPKNIKEMSQYFPEAYKELIQICEKLEIQYNEIQDIEFTVENEKLYILQKRKAVSSDLATTKLNYELLEKGIITKEKLFSSIKIQSIMPQEIVNANQKNSLAKGLIANPGVLRGIIVHNNEDMVKYAEEYKKYDKEKNFGWIFYSPETSPDHASIMIKTQGFITSNGGFTSHAAILARSWKKPCVVGIGQSLDSGKLVTLDATNGVIYEGILPLINNRNNEMKKIINTLLKHHKMNVKEINKTNPFENTIKEINSHVSWMENFTKCKFVKPTVKPQTSNFLQLGNKIAMLILKEKNKPSSEIITQPTFRI